MNMTMTQLAKLAGVTQPVVSAVLNKSTRNRVSPEKRAKILKLAAKYSYTPNQVARSLVTKKTRIINVVIPSARFFQYSNYSTIVTGLQVAAEERDYRLKFTSLSRGYQDLSPLSGTIADGSVVFYWGGPLNDRVVRTLKKKGQPFVAAYGKCDLPKTHNLYFDNRTAMYGMAKHVIAQGHKRLVYLPAFDYDIFNYEGTLGVRRAAAEHPETAVQEQVLQVPKEIEDDPEGLFAFGKKTMREILAQPRRPEAAIFNNDGIAAGALEAAQEADLRVPDKMTITGNGKEPYAALCRPQLTTVDWRPFEYGRKTGALLFSLMDGNRPSLYQEPFTITPLFRETG